jgi:hypothetical protein
MVPTTVRDALRTVDEYDSTVAFEHHFMGAEKVFNVA